MATIGFWIQTFFVYVGWWLVPLVILFGYRKQLSKYPIQVIIYEKRGDNIIMTNDVAGRFNDPVNCYKLKMTKDSIPIPEYDWILQYMYKPTNVLEKFANLLSGKIGSITLFKYSSKQYKPIHVRMPNGKMEKKFREMKDKDGNTIYTHVYEFIKPTNALTKLDFEVIDWDDINHMTQELRAIALRRSPVQKFLERYGGMIGLIIGFMALIFAGYYYVELLKDGGNKFVSQTQGAAKTNAPAEVPNIPLIGDLG